MSSSLYRAVTQRLKELCEPRRRKLNTHLLDRKSLTLSDDHSCDNTTPEGQPPCRLSPLKTFSLSLFPLSLSSCQGVTIFMEEDFWGLFKSLSPTATLKNRWPPTTTPTLSGARSPEEEGETTSKTERECSYYGNIRSYIAMGTGSSRARFV